MKLKADNTSLYGFFLILIIFIIILSFSAVTLAMLSRLVDNRIEVSSLQENWLQIKSGALALLFAESPKNGKDELEKKIGAFEKHMGLQSMEQRVGLLKGQINITSQPGEGTRVLIELPLNIREEKDGREV